MCYQHLFFDLDHTLWDHDRNADETLEHLYHHFQLNQHYNLTIPIFIEAFHKVNQVLWKDYHLGKVNQEFIRKERFKKVMELLQIPEFRRCHDVAEQYLYHCPRKSNLMPNALETLDYLKPKYSMSIITNGFAEIQHLKLSSSGLDAYFDTVITSEHSGWLKPQQGIFNFALQQAGRLNEECIMIGDNPTTDISGARQAGIDQIYYDPTDLNAVPNPTYRIHNLLQLKELL